MVIVRGISRRSLSVTLRVALAMATLLAAVLTVRSLWSVDGRFVDIPDLRFLALTAVFGSLDIVDVAVRCLLRRRQYGTRPSTPTSIALDVGTFTPSQIEHHLKPYAIVLSVHNIEPELDQILDSLAEYRDQLWIIDDASTDGSVARLRREGVRLIEGVVNRKKPAALRELVARLPADVQTVVVMDPDSRILNSDPIGASDLERVVFEFQRTDMAALCPCLTVIDDGLIGRLQHLEYWLSFTLGRASLGDRSVTSGIAIYRRDALALALSSASCVYAEDLRNTYVLLAAGENIYYDGRLIVQTAGKPTWASWFSQRVGWYFGLIKVYVENWRGIKSWSRDSFMWRYHFVFYTAFWSMACQPMRVLAACVLAFSMLAGVDRLMGLDLVPINTLTDPGYFLFSYIQCVTLLLLLLLAFGGAEDRWFWLRALSAVPVYFFYALVHNLPISVGYLNWFTLRWWGRRLYRDHFQSDAELLRQMQLVRQ